MTGSCFSCGHAPGSPDQQAPGHLPTQILVEEHTLILQALDALERKIAQVESGAPADPAYFQKAVEFLRTFADKCHHGKEEHLLFKTMVERGFPREAGPIAVMLHEHDVGRAFVRGIAEAAASPALDGAAIRRIIENGRGFVQLLRAHIDKENSILFPMADNLLSPEDHAYLEKEFERFEAEETGVGFHQAMQKLLDELKAGAR
jgi:hemerythrin-like domain-containing protein